MEQDRYKEYIETMEDTGIYPEELNKIGLRLRKRLRRRQYKLLFGSSGIITGVFLLFTILVNTNTVIADAIFDIPVIGALAEYVSFDKGLQNAIDNKYVQEVNLVQESNGYTLGLPYVIADSKRLVLFFQLPEDMIAQDNMNYQVSVDNITDLSGAILPTTIRYMNFESKIKPNKEGLIVVSIRTPAAIIPQKLKLSASLKIQNPKYNNHTDEFDDLPKDLFQTLESFTFDLQLNDYKEPNILIQDQVLQVKDQTLHINSVTEYPTGIEISVTFPESNSSIISDLDFKAIDSEGNEWKQTDSSASYYSDTSRTLLCYLENNYYDLAPLESLEIIGSAMFNKSEQYITVDLLNKTLSPKPSDMNIINVEMKDEKANITFETDGLIYRNYFDFNYTDLDGTEYKLDHISSDTRDNKSQIYLSVISGTNHKVILERCEAPMLMLEQPVKVDLK